MHHMTVSTKHGDPGCRPVHRMHRNVDEGGRKVRLVHLAHLMAISLPRMVQVVTACIRRQPVWR
jgi:hypothetical protein